MRLFTDRIKTSLWFKGGVVAFLKIKMNPLKLAYTDFPAQLKSLQRITVTIRVKRHKASIP